MVLPPRQVHVVRVRREAEQLRAALGEVAMAAAELRDLRRTDEREVHRPGEQDQPLAGVAVLIEGGELLTDIEAGDRLQGERGQLVSNGEHRRISYNMSRFR